MDLSNLVGAMLSVSVDTVGIAPKPDSGSASDNAAANYGNPSAVVLQIPAGGNIGNLISWYTNSDDYLWMQTDCSTIKEAIDSNNPGPDEYWFQFSAGTYTTSDGQPVTVDAAGLAGGGIVQYRLLSVLQKLLPGLGNGGGFSPFGSGGGAMQLPSSVVAALLWLFIVFVFFVFYKMFKNSRHGR